MQQNSFYQQASSGINNALNRSLSERIHEILNKLSLRYKDVCQEAFIDENSFSKWLEQDPSYDFTLLEQALEKWILSKQPSQQDEKQFFQLNATYLRRLDIDQMAASQWIEIPNKEKIPVGESNTDHFVPISIDVELDGQTYKENIIWNCMEPYITTDNFARQVAKDNRLSLAMEQEIANSLKKSVNSYRFYEAKDKEAIRQIELNVVIDNVQLKDKFEWDINDSQNSPEIFAMDMCAELGLNGEFAQRIAFQIREQIISHQKQITDKRLSAQQYHNLKKSTRSLIEASTSYDPALHASTLVTSENYLRPLIDDNETQWEPKLQILAPEDIRKLQKEEQRKQRILRRNR